MAGEGLYETPRFPALCRRGVSSNGIPERTALRVVGNELDGLQLRARHPHSDVGANQHVDQNGERGQPKIASD